VSNELDGKVALGTGAGRGIGRAIAIALARAGANVAVNFISREEEAENVSLEIKTFGRRTLAVKADVSISNEVSRMVEQIEKELGVISILVNNAGISRPQPLDQITERDWDEILSVNLKSMFLATQAVLPAMRKQRWGGSSIFRPWPHSLAESSGRITRPQRQGALV
jgi:3-oxoacyl-[acyl-carrier protein] reductase